MAMCSQCVHHGKPDCNFADCKLGMFQGYEDIYRQRDCLCYTTSFGHAKNWKEEYGYVAWLNSFYVYESYRNPEGYYRALRECLDENYGTGGEIFFEKEAGKLIYETPDHEYRVYMDKDKYLYLFKRIDY